MTPRGGKLAPRHDARTLRAASFYRKRRTPPPAALTWPIAGAWPMFANDEIGCCAVATCGHQSIAWAQSTGTAEQRPAPTEADIRAAYSTISGYPETGDVGCVMLDVLKHWRKHGIGPSRIDGFAAVDAHDRADIMHAIHAFGGVALGMNIPEKAMHDRAWTWRHAAMNGPRFGHAVDVIGYDGGGVYLVTWGEERHASWAFVEACADEAWALVSHEWLAPDGRTPNGIDLAALTEAIARAGMTPPEDAPTFGAERHDTEPAPKRVPWFDLG